MTETILDLETSQKSSVCSVLFLSSFLQTFEPDLADVQINGGNPMVDEEWNEFLSQCDKMTTFRHRPTNSLILDDLSVNDINTTR